MSNLKEVKLSEVIALLKRGYTRWIKEEVLENRSIQRHYGLTFSESKELFAHPKLKGLKTHFPTLEIVDDLPTGAHGPRTTTEVSPEVPQQDVPRQDPYSSVPSRDIVEFTEEPAEPQQAPEAQETPVVSMQQVLEEQDQLLEDVFETEDDLDKDDDKLYMDRERPEQAQGTLVVDVPPIAEDPRDIREVHEEQPGTEEQNEQDQRAIATLVHALNEVQDDSLPSEEQIDEAAQMQKMREIMKSEIVPEPRVEEPVVNAKIEASKEKKASKETDDIMDIFN